MGRNAIETVLGAVVLVIAGLFLAFAYTRSNVQTINGYTVNAYFPMVDGLKDGTDVKINGVKVGSVTGLALVTDPGVNQYKVDVKMSIKPGILLPDDTIAMVSSEGLLGGKYLSLEIGIDEETIPTDGKGIITHTQSPMRLDDLIGQLIYGMKKSNSGTQAPSAPPPPVPEKPPVSSAPVAPSHATSAPIATPKVVSPPMKTTPVIVPPKPARVPSVAKPTPAELAPKILTHSEPPKAPDSVKSPPVPITSSPEETNTTVSPPAIPGYSPNNLSPKPPENVPQEPTSSSSVPSPEPAHP